MLDSAHVSLGVHSASMKMTNATAAAEMLSLNFVSLKVLLGYDMSQIPSILKEPFEHPLIPNYIDFRSRIHPTDNNEYSKLKTYLYNAIA